MKKAILIIINLSWVAVCIAAPSIRSLTLVDPYREPNQDLYDLTQYTNQREVKAMISMTGDVNLVYFTEDTNAWPQGRPYTGREYRFFLDETDREATVYARVADRNGNYSNIIDASIILDTTAPSRSNASIFVVGEDAYINTDKAMICWYGFADLNMPVGSGVAGYYYSSAELNLSIVWLPENCVWKENLPELTFTFMVTCQDHAGNVSLPIRNEICVDLHPPSNVSAKVTIENRERCTNKTDLFILWKDFQDIGSCYSAPGIYEYRIEYYLDDDPIAPDMNDRPPVTPLQELVWRNAPEGDCEVWIYPVDRAGNIGAPGLAGIEVEREAPKILMAGYWDSVVATEATTQLTMTALIPYKDVSEAPVYYLHPEWGWILTDLALNDRGINGDAYSRDYIFTLNEDIPPSEFPSLHLLGLYAEDRCGNIARPWPFFYVGD